MQSFDVTRNNFGRRTFHLARLAGEIFNMRALEREFHCPGREKNLLRTCDDFDGMKEIQMEYLEEKHKQRLLNEEGVGNETGNA